MGKHITPGPWVNKLFTVQTEDGTIIADCYVKQVITNAKRPPKEYEANARLLACAPEMFDALVAAEQLLKVASFGGKSLYASRVRTQITALIDKALNQEAVAQEGVR